MRAKPGDGLFIAAALLCCVAPGCAVRHGPNPAAAPILAASEPVRPAISRPNGTVLVVRTDGFAAADGMLQERAQLLRAIGDSGAGAILPLVEVVVHRDDGRTVALMESPHDGPVVGERVHLVDGTSVQQTGSASR